MSAGAFTNSRYTADDGTIYPIRVQPETLALTLGGTANTAPTGAVTGKIRARTSGGRRRYGVHARKVAIRFTGAVPDGYAANSIITLPILQPALYNALVSGGTTGTYLGNAVEVVYKTAEKTK